MLLGLMQVMKLNFKMKSKIKTRLNLSAKIVAVLYIILITMFAFDVPILSWGFLIHLIPTIIFVICLVVALFKPKIGGILFILAGIWTMIFFNTYRDWFVFLVISLVPIITGILFFISKRKK